MDEDQKINLTENNAVKSYWNNRYSKEQTGWDRGEINSALTNWLLQKQLEPCSILIPGCGRGHEVIELAKLDFHVTAIDLADEPLQILRQNMAQTAARAEVIQGNVFEFSPVQQFDAVYDQTCLCAISPDLRAQYEQKLYDWLRVDGKLFILFVQTENTSDEPPFHCDLESMRSLFPKHRWSWSHKDPVRFEHPSGRIFELATILTKKGEPHVG